MQDRLLVGLLCLGLLWPLPGSTESPNSDAIKAGFLLNFAQFATWPSGDGRDTSLAFCIEAQTIEPRIFGSDGAIRVGKRTISVTTVPQQRLMDGRFNCDMIFVGSPKPDLAPLLAAATQRNILLVSDQAGFAGRGGHIELFLRDGKYRFRINLTSLEASGIKLSSKVLRLAEIVRSDSGS